MSVPAPRRIVLAVLTSGSYGREVVQGVMEYAARSAPHWQFHFEGACNHPDVLPRLRLAMTEWHAHGILGQLLHGRLPALVRSSGLPAVNVSTSKLTDIPSVLVDNQLVGEMAARSLRGVGVRQFAIVGRADCLYTNQRADAFRAALARDGLPCISFQPNPARPLTWLQEYRLLVAWLRTAPRPLGLFACDDRCGSDVLQACQVLRIRVPDDVAVLGVDDDETACMLSVPPLSSVILPSRTIGFRAAEMLDRLMSGAAPDRQPLLLPPAGIAARLSTDVSAVGDPNAAAALRFIHRHAGRAITVRDVLVAAPQSRRALERRFLALLGRTPKQEIRRVQLERAKLMLAQTDLKIQAVAAETGFSRYALFAEVFRTAVGLTPSAYRAQYRHTRQPPRPNPAHPAPNRRKPG